MSDTKSAVPLTGAQKAAVVLMNLDQEAAAHIMQELTEVESEEIAAEILRLKRVDADIADAALTEYHDLALHSAGRLRGGRDVATGLLEASFGQEKAAGVLSRVASSLAGRAFEFLEQADAGQVALLLDGELPQTAAVVLAHMSPDQASAVLDILDVEFRVEAAHCLATMSKASPEAVRVVAETLRARAGAVVPNREQVEPAGGVQPLVDIINRSSVASENALLDALGRRDPELAEEVRSRMLTFSDIVKLEARDVQQVLRGIDTAVLALAMKGAPETVQETIRANISERNRAALDEEMEVMGAQRLSKVEDARSEVVRAIRQLDAEGVISVHRGDEGEYVE
ncbi:MAG TPA: flagellar motor switch protein FliG [Microbacteriaceae bacterium]|nr:flagellar motor switch protein FliG [Microbacteriaceae bacterium]